MDPALHNRVYGDRINKETILEHTEYLKPCHLHCTIENHVRRVGFEARS